MEPLTRLVAESLARHGLDRPVDPRRLQWSRWSRCDSPHSLLVVPSKPGIFALAEEVANFDAGNSHVGTAALESLPRAQPRGPSERSSAMPAVDSGSDFSFSDREGHDREGHDREGHDFSRAETGARQSGALAPEGLLGNASAEELLGGVALQLCDSLPLTNAASAADSAHRMLAVLQFSEDDDMAFVLDRMFTRPNPVRARLASGRCFLRFVVIEDQAQRRSLCSALNKWLISSAEKASGISADFASSLELTGRVGAGDSPAHVYRATLPRPAVQSAPAPDSTPPTAAQHLSSGAATNIHCPQPLPSGF